MASAQDCLAGNKFFDLLILVAIETVDPCNWCVFDPKLIDKRPTTKQPHVVQNNTNTYAQLSVFRLIDGCSNNGILHTEHFFVHFSEVKFLWK